MATDSTVDTVGGRPRSRAKKACKSCNSRRVRCNVVEEQPCKNCKIADVPCELVKSRRGKYERHPQSRVSNHPKSPKNAENLESSFKHSICENEEAPGGSNSISQEQPSSTNGDLASRTTASIFHVAHPNTASTTPTINGADSTVFLGESSSISLVHGPQTPSASNQPSPGDRTRLRYPIPDAVSIKTSTTLFEDRRKAARIEYLTKDGAFTYPSSKVCEVLLGAYFEWFHPCFPILDRNEFCNSYVTKTISPLLFRAVLFVGATHCNEDVMRGLGFPARQDARNQMYNHIKDIYDADYETDKVTVSQALFLMSFWRAGPLLEKDTRHWLGAAISLAQTKGMHRSSATTTFPDGRRGLRKRIWWSLYIRDRQCSAALGLPIRIRDEDCDIEMLEMSDFEQEDHSAYPKYLGVQKREHVLFVIQMAKLSVYFGKIVLREFSSIGLPKKDSERSQLRDDLMKWDSELSLEMTANATASSFWASMLHLSYNNLYILLYRSAYLTEHDGQGAGNIALQAACRNTRIIEDVLAQDMVQHLSVHVTTSLFNSLCIHTICLRRSQNPTRKLAECRAQLCLLGLRELQKTWDVTNWVLQLFLEFLDQSTAKKLQIIADSEDAPLQQSMIASVSNPETADTSNFNLDFGMTGNGGGLGMGRDDRARSLDFVSHFFGTKEAEDFSLFQLQPDLFSGDLFDGGLDQYYNSFLPKEGPNDGGFQ